MKRIKTGKHACVSKEMKQWLTNAKNLKEVDKIILGMTKNIRHKFSPGDVVFRKYLIKGLHFSCYTGNGIRQVYIYCDNQYKEFLKNKLSTKGES